MAGIGVLSAGAGVGVSDIAGLGVLNEGYSIEEKD